MSEPTQPTKAQQASALVEQLEQALRTAAGGVDPNVQAIADKLKALLQPTKA